MQVEQIYNFLDSVAPFANQEEWDNSGLQVGVQKQPIHRILFALDATAQLVYEAQKKACDLIVTHHPFLFSPQKQFIEENPAFLAAKFGISVISAHTSYDGAVGGVNDVLAEMLGLTGVRPSENKMFRLGYTDCKTAVAFARYAGGILHTPVQVTLPQREIHLVAVCGGAAMEYAQAARNEGADLFLTGDLKHHEALDAAEIGLSVAAAGHFATEFPAVVALHKRVQEAFPTIPCLLSEQTAPMKLID